MISVYQQKTNNQVTSRDYNSMKKYIRLIQWGRKNPVQFIEIVFGITLMDYQKWLVSNSWTKEYVCWVCSRNAGKSFLVGCFVMARNILFPKLTTQIISENWVTANDTFKKMEDIATNNIKTIINTNTVFIDELYKTKSDSDGFTHDFKAGNKCALLNGSNINAIAGSSRGARGRRSNMNIYDEAGFINQDTFDITEPYMAQSAEFKLGANFDPEVYPQDICNIRLYIGSASDTSSNFYAKYKEGTKQMLAGNDKYFVADLNCEIPKHPTVKGKPVGALLSQDEIDRKKRENEIACNREYYNIFDSFDSETALVTRTDIFSNTEVRAPQLQWGGKKHKYLICYDPASRTDNSPVFVMEICKNDQKEIFGRCVHMENLIVTYNDGSKRPMRLDEQVKRLWELIYEYNGKDNVAPYENITLIMDAGSGGQANALAQELCKDWVDSNGRTHPGIYDENHEFSRLWAEPYKNCIKGSMKFVEPRKFRNDLFGAAKVLVPQGLIKFAPQCPKYDILVMEDGTEHKLSKAEMASLIQMDLMKEEIMAMAAIKSATTGVVTYQLPPDKRNLMHDDRAYVFVLGCWEIKNLREEETYGDGVELDYSKMFTKSKKDDVITDPWAKAMRGMSGNHKRISPFSGKSPFHK